MPSQSFSALQSQFPDYEVEFLKEFHDSGAALSGIESAYNT